MVSAIRKRGSGQETNIAQGAAEYYISLETMPKYYILDSAQAYPEFNLKSELVELKALVSLGL